MNGERICGGCERAFTPANDRALYCSTACRKVAYRRRAKGDADSARLEPLVWQLARDGELDGLDALELLLFPPADVLVALQTVAA